MGAKSTQEGVAGERSGPEAGRMQGHWLLAKLGKRILRPGGRALTAKLLEQAKPTADDDIVELGPGVGATAEVLLRANPRSYRGVDPNPEGRDAVKNILKKHPRADYVVADARETGLEDACADLVVGEAMLTIQDDAGKNAIVAEAARLLRELTVERPLAFQAAVFAELIRKGKFRPADPEALALAFWGPILAILVAAEEPGREPEAQRLLDLHLEHFRRTHSVGAGRARGRRKP